ncbi:alcohol dehydrogenase catalytic domain-containing protein [Lacinutrix sp. Hel_I_90]|uniref:alcohol dehydrogenase catalytic domain-containing protein n=1 Tax=Lacinutrix sp. Hel_I_90 TaxID=1249999 RepID=UPI0005C84786|nr:alcohol dehydrogenase catalytic domain-containing protein [Lacinutrix sp. Hel_I_90]
MKTLAVLSPSLDKKIEDKHKSYIPIDSLKIPLALIDVPDEEFLENDERYNDTVLVRKKGFSLNYRDLGIIENAWNKLKDFDGDTYYPIGSDFCGEVVKIGKNVDNLKIGDFVIQDGFYPNYQGSGKPGIPTNHGSKELEVLHKKKLMKLPKGFPVNIASGIGIGAQTGMSMIKKAQIKKGENILVTSVTSYTSLFLLSILKDYDCNIYGLSYSGSEIGSVKEKFPFIKEVFSFKDDSIPKNITFDVVFDPFSDTYFPYLLLNKKLNYNCKYLTCGFFSQSSEKKLGDKGIKLPLLLSHLILYNVHLIGNCLGSTEDLKDGIKILNKENSVPIDSEFSENDNINDFVLKSFNLEKNRFGKVCFIY